MADMKIGHWAFIVAAILAIIASFVDLGPSVVWILAVLGLVVGFLNISTKEASPFLIATIALIVALGTVGGKFTGFQGASTVKDILDNVILIAGPAAIVVAVKDIYARARD